MPFKSYVRSTGCNDVSHRQKFNRNGVGQTRKLGFRLLVCPHVSTLIQSCLRKLAFQARFFDGV